MSSEPWTDNKAEQDEGLGLDNSTSSSQTLPQPYQGADKDAIHGLARQLSRRSSLSTGDALPFGTNGDTRLDPNSSDFDSSAWARNLYRLMQNASPETAQDRRLGVCFENLSAWGESTGDLDYQLTVGNAPLWLGQKIKGMISKGNTKPVEILKPMDGVLKPSEMLVVLGRPGSGCSTFLRTLAAQTYGFKLSSDSKIHYNGLEQHEIARSYRGDVTYCAESELHFPQMTVGDTLMFAARMKTPANRLPGVSRHDYAQHMRDVIMATFGLLHTMNTRVGNDLIRGVSGGERKRVSIAELALCGSVLQCWDNATRGLDSATALEFVRTLRTASDVFGTTSAVAIYQASEEMYEMFDKTVVLYDGYEIYYGPVSRARDFFYEMGWQPKPRQPTPDFLTSLSQPSEREAREGWENKVPRTAQEFNRRWRESALYAEVQNEIQEFNAANPVGSSQTAAAFAQANKARQHKSLPRNVSYTVSWAEQVKILTWRGFKRIAGDPTMPATSVFGNFIMGLIIASMFYNLQGTTSSFYSRSAVVFFALLFNAFSCMLEIFALYEARPVVQKHHLYALYHPGPDALASIITELPVKLSVCISFNLVIYFMVNLRREPGNFFFFLFTMFLSVLSMSHVFRTIGALTQTIAQAMVPAAFLLLVLVLFTGFVVPVHNMHKWCRWLNHVDPLAYSFESLMTNEFHNREFFCDQLVPSGGAYNSADIVNRVCSVAGAEAGSQYVLGDTYLSVSYEYEFAHQWRNIGILFAFILFSLFTYMLCVWLNPGVRTKGELLVYPRAILRKMYRNRSASDDLEAGAEKTAVGSSNSETEGAEDKLIDSSNDIFYWKDLVYDIKIKGEDRRILNYVDGWVKPGTLTALMGASGAGKTTLLDTLANRVTMGVVSGDMYVNGIPRDNSFQRSTGYAMQQDLHLETSTVREALVFSAVLRQPHSIPYEEKMAYVENVLKILEMETYADAVVGVPGAGLNVEQRKRLTIGVELAARPKLLLFLDEPTSGLDSQTAWSVCQLMKKLSNAGQAILCTIHQPSALLLNEFDRLLFLARGGRTVYFGDIGPNARTLTGYFEKYGADPCPADANPAEWMLSVIGAAPGSHAKHDYAEVWLKSEERQAVRSEINSLMTRFNASPDNKHEGVEENREFAAPFYVQFQLFVYRLWQQYWRTPTYLWAKIALSIATALFNGFVFFKADNTLQGMQNMMYSVFMFTTLLTALIQQYLPSYVAQRNLYETRERPSKIVSWKAFISAVIVAEIPWQVFSAVLSFLCWYYPVGLYGNVPDGPGHRQQLAERGGLTCFYVILFFLFATTLGQLVAAGMEDDATASNVAMMLFILTLMFCGVLRTKDEMPGFWKFMYRVSPMTYWIGGMLALALANADVYCADYEYLQLTAPSGQTCGEYMGTYISAAGGYLKDASASVCEYCTISQTNTFLASINAPYSDRWRNFGILWSYIIFNMAGTIFLYWLARVPKKSSRVKKSEPRPLEADPALEAFGANGPK